VTEPQPIEGWSWSEPVPWFVMPRSPASWGGAAALWVTVAGWAGAARRRFGAEAPILVPGGVLDEAGALDATRLAASGSTSGSRGWKAHIPPGLKQAVKDVRTGVDQRRYASRVIDRVPADVSPPFVWQHHELFHRAGERLARRVDVPLVSYVHAPIVWEARRWGVGRRGSGTLLERFAERPSLRESDVVACVSEEVVDALTRFGVAQERIVVAPMAVDSERFAPSADRLRRGTDEPLRVGWVGSFRKFHAIDLLLHAAVELRGDGLDVRVVLIGDGFERQRLVELVDELALAGTVEFRGQVANTELPAELDRLDAAVITAASGQEFHYSPLKLREYMAMALPVVAPRIGDVERMLTHGETGFLYEPGDVSGMAAALSALAHDLDRGAQVGSNGRHRLLTDGTWDSVVHLVCTRLESV
jgi:glycosyltransferase involved in cell wall biosynthesis